MVAVRRRRVGALALLLVRADQRLVHVLGAGDLPSRKEQGGRGGHTRSRPSLRHSTSLADSSSPLRYVGSCRLREQDMARDERGGILPLVGLI